MNLGQKASELLASWGAFTDDRRSLVVECDSKSLAAEVTAADQLSCALDRLIIEPRVPQQLSADELRGWGDRVVKRVRYLLEAIETVELDTTQGEMLIRSTPPEKKADGTVFFYELRLEAAGRLSLERRRFEPKSRARELESMQFTRELFEKLVNDLAQTAP